MTPPSIVEQCSQTYQNHFDKVLESSGTPEEAIDYCIHQYLDGKPAKKGYTTQVQSTALWKCHFWQKVPVSCYYSDPAAYALGRSLHFGLSDTEILKDLLHRTPNTLIRGIRYSQIFLQPDSKAWQQILLLSEDANEDFLRFLLVCKKLYYELNSYDKLIVDLQRQLDELTVFEFLLYSSLFTFQNLVPEPSDVLAAVNNEWFEVQQGVSDALNELLVWKLKTRDNNDLRLNERFLARSLKLHLMPLLIPGEGTSSVGLRNIEIFNRLVAAVMQRNDFQQRTTSEFCFDDDYRFRFDGDQLTIYPIEIPEESDWDVNGRKLSILHRYWFNRAIMDYFQSDLPEKKFGLQENDVFNRLAYIKAYQIFLHLDEVFGIDSQIALPDTSQVDLFMAIHSLELMTAFFNISYIGEFQKYRQDSGNWLNALSRLMLQGISSGENRFPLTWAEPSEKAQRIKSWTVSDAHPEGNLKLAEDILKFWTMDLQELSESLKESPDIPIPEFHERPIIKLGMYSFQLPWLMATQNNSTAALNNLRRIGCRRKERKAETHRIESRLGDLFHSKGFNVVQSYEPEMINDNDPGEIDLLCYMEGHLLLLEIKSTYLRKTKQEVWLHRTTTLRKAARQLERKKNALSHALKHDVDLRSELQIPAHIDDIKIHPWIVDTSIEHDQELIDGYLKVSLEGLVVILRNERQLLTGNLLMDENLPEDDMFPEGFSAQQFVEIVEEGNLWSVLSVE